ncbi:MAG: ATP-binding protein [Lachnospiraceae bacterium]|nr:ATP-binding protein [Lachnospiraceae bacterium]
MKRLLMGQLKAWKNKKNRKPLLIRGARQVGKTWLMKEFGRQNFEKVVYISFDNNERMKSVFEMDFDIPRIISALKVESGVKIESQNTLLIFDEIQEVPKALTCLKYFCENAPEYAIICAGSLLGVALHEGTSFPVGKVDFLNLYPMSFREFLLAAGEDELAEFLNQQDYEMISIFSDKYADLLRKYYYVGGMPEVVSTWLETDDMYEVRNIQQELLSYYANDFSKHAPTETVPRIQMVWNSIPMQLTKENKKFIFGMVREGARAKDFELAIQWLLDCGLIQKGYRVSKPGLPLIAYMEMNTFKLYFLDVGLLTAMCELDARTLLEGNRIFTEFKGALTEQFVAQELAASGISLYYYSTENSSGEIDFVVQAGGRIIPIEVKAEENLQAKSLRSYCQKYKPEIAVRTSMSKYREQDWMVNVPLYALTAYLENIQKK